MTQISEDHGALMDGIYRYQRLFYDVTRKYYLLGRDHLIQELAAKPGAHVLEVACGTGRNLARIGKLYPQAHLYGFDISEQMLTTARAKLGDRAVLARGDACAYDPQALFGRAEFDHIVFSYSLSMIPDWRGALEESAKYLAPGGSMHVVDFGDQKDLPGWFKSMLVAWLDRFHVSPRADLHEALDGLSGEAHFAPLYRRYAFYGRVTG